MSGIIIQIIGWIGTCLIVLAYFLISNKKIESVSKIYQLMNLFGAIGVAVNVFYQKAWQGFTLEVI
jgi:cell division protein FtsW (lipid II flippase)